MILKMLPAIEELEEIKSVKALIDEFDYKYCSPEDSVEDFDNADCIVNKIVEMIFNASMLRSMMYRERYMKKSYNLYRCMIDKGLSNLEYKDIDEKLQLLGLLKLKDYMAIQVLKNKQLKKIKK